MDKEFWTVAYRKPRANYFHRVTDWAGDWDEAGGIGCDSVTARTELTMHAINNGWTVRPSIYERDLSYSKGDRQVVVLFDTRETVDVATLWQERKLIDTKMSGKHERRVVYDWLRA